MKKVLILAVLVGLVLPVGRSLATDDIQSALQLMHHKEFHFRSIANGARATINVSKYGRPIELTFSTTGKDSVLAFCHPSDAVLDATLDQSARWDRFGTGGADGATSVPETFTYGNVGLDSLRIHNYSGGTILVRTWSWRR